MKEITQKIIYEVNVTHFTTCSNIKIVQKVSNMMEKCIAFSAFFMYANSYDIGIA